jgi:type I restriction enzyme S subunit
MKSGYKQTEVGIIPEDWETEYLGVICDVRDGTHESPRFFESGVPFVTSKNIVEGRLDLENVSYISNADAIEFDKRSKVDRNDILMSMIGTIGSAALIDFDPNFCIKNVALLKPRNVQPPFLIQLINSSLFQRYLRENLDGGIQKFISLGTLRQLLIPVPKAQEQRAIAGALSEVDALLGAQEALLAKKRDLKAAAMQQLLTGQKRLPSFTGEWEVKTFGEVLTRINAKPHQIQTSDYQPSGRYPVVDQGKNAVIGFSDREEKQLRCPKGGVIVFGDHTCIVKFIDFNFLVGADGTQILQAKAGQNTRFHALQLQYRGIETTGYNRHFKFLKEREFVSPPLAEQTAIAAVLSDMDAEIAALEAQRDKTRTLKQGMMQELLTGRIRLV